MVESAPFTVADNPAESRFEVVDQAGAVAGFSAYRRYDDRIVFTHTEIDDAWEGHGIGSQLVRESLDAVRAEGLRVVAQCPFVKEYISRHPEYADLTGK